MDTNGNINRLFVSYELALELKEKGFDEEIMGWYNPDKHFILPLGYKWITIDNNHPKRNSDFNYEGSLEFIAAPLYQQVIDWFREKYNIVIETLIFDKGFLENDKFCFQWRIYDNTEEWFTNTTEYKTPIEAKIEAIEEALKLII